MNKDGFWIENQKGIKSLAREYFTKLFESQIVDHGRVINAVQTILSDTDNFNLTCLIQDDWIQANPFSMHPDKSLGPSGLNLAFIQHFWDICGVEISQAC